MPEKKYYWLKLQSNFFQQKEMKKLRRMAGGDTYTIIYLKMQLLSLKNEGVILFENVEENIAEELALELDESTEDIQMTLIFLQNHGLIEALSTDEYLLPKAAECMGRESASAERMRRLRDKQRPSQSDALTSHSDIDVTDRDADVTQRKRRDREDKEIEGENTAAIASPPTSYNEILDLYNSICKSFPKVNCLSDTRKRAIKARLNTYSLNDFRKLFEIAESTPFLKGKNDRNWAAKFDWLIKDSNMAKVLDGNYNEKAPLNSGAATPSSIKNYDEPF